MGELTSSRRSFLRHALSLVVLSAASPLVTLGRLVPDISRSESGKVVATYTMKLSDFPALQAVGGSIKLVADQLLQLNPDHVANFDIFDDIDFPIAITRVAESGTDDFRAVSTYCPHAAGFQVEDYDPLNARFVCPHAGSTFEADGTWIHPDDPRAADNTAPKSSTVRKGLLKFPVTFDGNDTITIDQVLALSAGQGEALPEKLLLDQNYPNPFNPTTLIRFGLPSGTHVKLTIHTLLGNQIRTVIDGWQDAGYHTLDFSAQDLPSGVYFYRLQTGMGTMTRRMTVSK